MNRKLLFTGLICTAIALAVSCNSNETTNDSDSNTTESTDEGTNPKGIGPFENVELTHPLDESMVASGKNIYEVKCASCHKLSEERLVGPGWKGVTERRTPEWIMNFIVNVEEMLEKDTAAQNMLEVCLVKMPNQNLSESDARATLEFMRKNDGKE